MFIRVIIFTLIATMPFAALSKGYRLLPSSDQIQDNHQRTEVTVWSNSPTIVAEIEGLRLLVSPRPDMLQTPWIGITYIVDNRQDPTNAVVANALSARAFMAGRELKRYTQAEQLAYLDKRKRSADFWGGISSGLAAMNASRTAGRYDYSGTSEGTVIDQYGNRAQVKGQYSGTLVDRDEAQRAGTEAAIDRSRAAYDTMQTMDSYSLQVLEYSPEQRIAPAGQESLKAYWVFDLPKVKREPMPVRLEVEINGKKFVFNFDLSR